MISERERLNVERRMHACDSCDANGSHAFAWMDTGMQFVSQQFE